MVHQQLWKALIYACDTIAMALQLCGTRQCGFTCEKLLQEESYIMIKTLKYCLKDGEMK